MSRARRTKPASPARRRCNSISATNAAYLNNPPNANFPAPSVTVSSTQATWQDVFAGSGDIGYTVAVQRSSGGPVYTQDPVIHNNDSSC
jgi:hypothetical protein